MMTINEASKLTGVSIRTLQYYDTIGLLKPSEYPASGYRLYDDTSLERLQQILLFKELEFPLKEIKTIIDAPDFDRNKALEQQIMISDFMQIFAEFGQMMSLEPSAEKVQLQVKKLQDYISEHFYNCTKEILSSLGKIYTSD